MLTKKHQISPKGGVAKAVRSYGVGDNDSITAPFGLIIELVFEVERATPSIGEIEQARSDSYRSIVCRLDLDTGSSGYKWM